MSNRNRIQNRQPGHLCEVKSKFDAEFRRFSVENNVAKRFEDFYRLLEAVHFLPNTEFLICYTDPEGDLLPINNDENFNKALSTAKPLLRVVIQRKGSSHLEFNGYGNTIPRKKTLVSKLVASDAARPTSRALQISMPEGFRRVSAIIDVDVVPETHRRVKLMKNGTDKPLGFYIRDGTSVRVTPHGLEKVPGIFVSRLVPGGLAESTGLLAVNDEVLEVNGIEVAGKTLDQVTDMMVANSSNLIVTVKPVNQRNNISPKRGGSGRLSQKSTTSYQSAAAQSTDSDDVTREMLSQDEDDDVIKDHLGATRSSTNQKTKNNNVQNVADQSVASVSSGDPILSSDYSDKQDSGVVTL